MGVYQSQLFGFNVSTQRERWWLNGAKTRPLDPPRVQENHLMMRCELVSWQYIQNIFYHIQILHKLHHVEKRKFGLFSQLEIFQRKSTAGSSVKLFSADPLELSCLDHLQRSLLKLMHAGKSKLRDGVRLSKTIRKSLLLNR